MERYSSILNNEITEANTKAVATSGAESIVAVDSGANITQAEVTSMVQNQESLVTHGADPNGSRLIQILEYNTSSGYYELASTSDYDIELISKSLSGFIGTWKSL